jgi:subtilisin family serine protease
MFLRSRRGPAAPHSNRPASTSAVFTWSRITALVAPALLVLMALGPAPASGQKPPDGTTGRTPLTATQFRDAVRAEGLDRKLERGQVPRAGTRLIVFLADPAAPVTADEPPAAQAAGPDDTPQAGKSSATAPRRGHGLDPDWTRRRKEEVATLSSAVRARHPRLRQVRPLTVVPMMVVEAPDHEALLELLRDPEVVRVIEDVPVTPATLQALPAAGFGPLAASHVGSGVVVAVVDHSVNATHTYFGCTAAGAPGCPIAGLTNIDPEARPPLVTMVSHGTAVASVVWAAAPGSRIWSVNVEKDIGGLYLSLTILGMDWVAANAAAKGIKVVAIPLVNEPGSSGVCNSSPYAPAVAALRAAGVAVIASTGNNGYSNRVLEPACAPGAVAVGATYDETTSSLSIYCQFGDYDNRETPVKDRVGCWVNRGSRLDLLAPGCVVVTPATGNFGCGTSFAVPLVAAAFARILGTDAGSMLSPDEVLDILNSTGKVVTDASGGFLGKQIQMDAALEKTLEERSAWLAERVTPWTMTALRLHLDPATATICCTEGGCHN